MRISDWSSDVCSSDLFTLAVPSIISHCPPQMMKQADYYEDVTDEGRIIRLTGNLSLACLGELPDRLTALPDEVAALDLSGVEHIDTVGAWLIHQQARDRGVRDNKRKSNRGGKRG